MAKSAAIAGAVCLWAACTIRAWDNDSVVDRRQAIIGKRVGQREYTSEKEDQKGEDDLERCDAHLELLDASIKKIPRICSQRSRHIVPSALGIMLRSLEATMGSRDRNRDIVP